MRDILPSPVRRMFLEEYGFTPQAPAGLGQLGTADSVRPIRRRQLGVGTIRRRANSTRPIQRGDISARRL